MSPLRSPLLRLISTLISLVFLGFGTTYMLSPRTGFSLYGFSREPLDWELMERVMVMYGAKDIFMSVAILAATWAGSRRSTGLVLLAAAACAGVDGYVVKGQAEAGEWNHWGYGAGVAVVGVVCLGVVG